VLAIDAGGTMTDTFVVDEAGQFVVGKAQTTPADESVGFMASARDALGYWGMEAEQALPGIVSGIYSGTAMLNPLLERKGRRVGKTLLEVEAVPPGYPVIHDFVPDLEGFYEQWLGRELPR
jgi:N-methylhydantoinase A/oxoprolinase/acetone carboxylase beta subunit